MQSGGEGVVCLLLGVCRAAPIADRSRPAELKQWRGDKYQEEAGYAEGGSPLQQLNKGVSVVLLQVVFFS